MDAGSGAGITIFGVKIGLYPEADLRLMGEILLTVYLSRQEDGIELAVTIILYF
jgi:hypothetical protein